MQPSTKIMQSRVSAVDLAMLTVVAIWGINSAVVKSSLAGWDQLAFNAIRFPGAALLLFAYLLLTDRQWRLKWSDLWRVAALGLVGNGFYQWLYIEAISRGTASNTSLIIAMSPVVVTLWGALAGTDRLSAWIYGGVAVSFAGAGLVIFGQQGGFHLGGPSLVGDLIAFGAMACWAGYTVYARGVIDRIGSSLRVTAWAMIFGAITNVLIGLPALLRQDYSLITTTSVSGMAFSAVFSLVAGYVIYAWAVSRVGGARTAIYLNLTPILSAVIAWLFIGEQWTVLQWSGALFVVVGVTVTKLEAAK